MPCQWAYMTYVSYNCLYRCPIFNGKILVMRLGARVIDYSAGIFKFSPNFLRFGTRGRCYTVEDMSVSILYWIIFLNSRAVWVWSLVSFANPFRLSNSRRFLSQLWLSARKIRIFRVVSLASLCCSREINFRSASIFSIQIDIFLSVNTCEHFKFYRSTVYVVVNDAILVLFCEMSCVYAVCYHGQYDGKCSHSVFYYLGGWRGWGRQHQLIQHTVHLDNLLSDLHKIS